MSDTMSGGRTRGSAPSRGARHAERELKGVTYHELEVARVEGGWRARLIFDV